MLPSQFNLCNFVKHCRIGGGRNAPDCGKGGKNPYLRKTWGRVSPAPQDAIVTPRQLA